MVVKGRMPREKAKDGKLTNADGTPMKFKSGKVCFNFQKDKNGGKVCKFTADECFHLHVKCDWTTFVQLWPPKNAGAVEQPAAEPPAKGKAKAGAKDKNKDKGGAQANAAAVAGGGGSDYTWVPKNTSEEVDGDVEDEE